MLDKHGNEVVFTPDRKFQQGLAVTGKSLMRSVAMGGRKVAFGTRSTALGES